MSSIAVNCLKLNLYSELEKFNAPEFEFLLVEGVGKAVDDKKADDQFKATFGAPVVKPLKSIIFFSSLVPSNVISHTDIALLLDH